MTKRILFTLMSFFIFSHVTAAGTETIPLKTVSINTFMNNGLTKTIPIQFKIPKQYQHAVMPVPVNYSYWMPADKVKQVKKTRKMPTDSGYMYGKITQSIGYDATTKKFIGLDNFKQESQRAGFTNIVISQKSVAGYPVYLFLMQQKSTGKQMHAMYLATKISTNVIYLAYRPPHKNKAIGQFVWDSFKKSLKAM